MYFFSCFKPQQTATESNPASRADQQNLNNRKTIRINLGTGLPEERDLTAREKNLLSYSTRYS